MTLLAVFLWAALALLAYTYVGYGLALALLARLKRWRRRRGGRASRRRFADWPRVTLVIAACDEAGVIAAKLANTRALDYPAACLDVLVVADGSTDATADLARAAGVRVLHRPARRGKMHALKRAMQHVATPLVAFTDANAMLAPGALRALVAPFADPAVGAVAGEKRVACVAADGAAGAGEGLYWRYESALKRLDAEVGSVVGGAGELFALRTPLFTPLPDDTVLDDFELTLRIAAAGHRVAYAPEATATERPSASLADEWTRKVRICAGGFQAMRRLAPLLDARRYGLLTWQYVSHRVLRWTLAPALLPLVLAASAVLAASGSALYGALLAAQLAAYGAAAVGWACEARRAGSAPRGAVLPLYVAMMHAAALAGLVRYLRGRQPATWTRARRAGLARVEG
jgi:cellulose synthase/poly-beta-1,6-N-acetylglucosamine synthase-like glycosyltransferase